MINAIAPHMPELWGGSADLAESNNTTIEGADSFLPPERGTKMWKANPYGRVLHFGIREHAMGAILNGIVLHGNTRVFGATFLIFSDYMRPSVRLAALMKAPTIYVWTHDSVALGEDGPTHQPVETLWASGRSRSSTSCAPATPTRPRPPGGPILERRKGPAGLALTRQNMPVFERGSGAADGDTYASAEGIAKGAYVFAEAPGGTPDVILIGTGSELQVAVEAREKLPGEGINARVVSAPCLEWFEEQDAEYKRVGAAGRGASARVSVEAGLSLGWRRYIGDAGRSVSVETFGASRRLPDPLREVRPDHRARRGGREGIPGPLTRFRPAEGAYMSITDTKAETPTAALSEAGVSIWLDDLSRERIKRARPREADRRARRRRRHDEPDDLRVGPLEGRGVRRAGQRDRSRGQGRRRGDLRDHHRATSATRRTCSATVYDRSNGYDGRVSIEVSPELAHDTDATIAEAKRLWSTIGKPNVMIKIPATVEGLPAITAAIAEGISVNVTLIFSLERYAAVIDAYFAGLEKAAEAGIDLSTIHSVASFFVSRVDTEVDKRLDAVGTDEATALKSKAAIANARLAYELFVERFATERAIALQEKGANRQRPLWASTGVKDPSLPDTLYVDAARHPRRREHDAREDARGRRRPRHRRGRHRGGQVRGREAGDRRRSRRWASTSTR